MLLENVGHLISELIAYSCHFLTPKTQKLGGWGQANLLQSFMYAWSHGAIANNDLLGLQLKGVRNLQYFGHLL